MAEGQRLQLPTGIAKNTHNANSFKPYNPGENIGDLTPTTQQPPKKSSKCGTFGIVLLAVIAVAVTVVTAGAAVAALAPASAGVTGGVLGGIGALAAGTTGLSAGALIGVGAVAGAVGSIASQGIGVATGIQAKFSWKGVALSALSGAVSAGIGPGGVFGKAGLFGVDVATKAGTTFVNGALAGVKSGVIRAGLNGIVSSAVTQGVAAATGLQSKFDFAGVAAAGVGAAVGSFVGDKLGLSALHDSRRGLSVGNIAGHTIANSASAIAGAATISAINGGSFGDNLMRALPNAIGSTIGNIIAGAVGGGGDLTGVERRAQRLLAEISQRYKSNGVDVSDEQIWVGSYLNIDPEFVTQLDIEAYDSTIVRVASIGRPKAIIDRDRSDHRYLKLRQYLTPDEAQIIDTEFLLLRSKGASVDAALRQVNVSARAELSSRGLDANLLQSIEIDWNFIADREGPSLQVAYVPEDNNGAVADRSGVTVGTGFDIGQQSVSDLRSLGLSSSLVRKLTPYTNRIKGAAVQALQQNPLTLSSKEVATLDAIIRGFKANAVGKDFNSLSQTGFQDLHYTQQTVVASVVFQYGSLRS